MAYQRYHTCPLGAGAAAVGGLEKVHLARVGVGAFEMAALQPDPTMATAGGSTGQTLTLHNRSGSSQLLLHLRDDLLKQHRALVVSLDRIKAWHLGGVKLTLQLFAPAACATGALCGSITGDFSGSETKHHALVEVQALDRQALEAFVSGFSAVHSGFAAAQKNTRAELSDVFDADGYDRHKAALLQSKSRGGVSFAPDKVVESALQALAKQDELFYELAGWEMGEELLTWACTGCNGQVTLPYHPTRIWPALLKDQPNGDGREWVDHLTCYGGHGPGSVCAQAVPAAAAVPTAAAAAAGAGPGGAGAKKKQTCGCCRREKQAGHAASCTHTFAACAACMKRRLAAVVAVACRRRSAQGSQELAGAQALLAQLEKGGSWNSRPEAWRKHKSAADALGAVLSALTRRAVLAGAAQ